MVITSHRLHDATYHKRYLEQRLYVRVLLHWNLKLCWIRIQFQRARSTVLVAYTANAHASHLTAR